MKIDALIGIGTAFLTAVSIFGGYLVYRWKQLKKVRIEIEDLNGTRIIGAIEKPDPRQILPPSSPTVSSSTETFK